MQEAQGMLRARGCREVVLWVLEGNMDARRFYEARGFGLDGTFKSVELGKTLKVVRHGKALEPVEPTG